MKKVRVGLNGFGRIGRAFTRIAFYRDDIEIAVINTRKTPNNMLAYLLQYDSVYRSFDGTVKEESNGISINGANVPAVQFANPSEIPWGKYEVDIVVDATGAFTTKELLQQHLRDSVKKVVLTAPAKDDLIPHVVLGVNDELIDWKNEHIISNASCTTNCAAPMFKVMQDTFRVMSGFLTTAHAYTLTQSLLDDTASSIDKSRAAAINIAPSTTGAAKAVAKTIPALKGRVDGMSIRVPVPTVSFTDCSIIVEKTPTVEEVNAAFKKASETTMQNILKYETVKLVSSDYIASPYSCIFDSNYTKVMPNNMVKIFGWYDNEWGYSNRLVDLVEKLSIFI